MIDETRDETKARKRKKLGKENKSGLNYYKREGINKRVWNKVELKEEHDDIFIELKLHLNFMLSLCYSLAHRFVALHPFSISYPKAWPHTS